MVDLTPEERRGKKLYQGYFLYRILKAKDSILKAYYFKGYPKFNVSVMRNQFSNSLNYHFFGEKVTRCKEMEKD